VPQSQAVSRARTRVSQAPGEIPGEIFAAGEGIPVPSPRTTEPSNACLVSPKSGRDVSTARTT
jgi:hypothetical protein